MFAYCNNNPVVRSDVNGRCSHVLDDDLVGVDIDGIVDAGGGGAASLVITLAFVGVMTSTRSKEETQAQSVALPTKKESISYTVYFLCASFDQSQTIIYVGRVISANFDSRMQYHRSRGRALVSRIDNLDYSTCRAIEQTGMIYYHTIHRGVPGNNQIRGISPHNSNRHIYWDALMRMANNGTYSSNHIIPLSYIMNLSEEAFLNGGV